MLKHKESLAHIMEDVDQRHKKLRADIEEEKKKHEFEMLNLSEQNHEILSIFIDYLFIYDNI